MPDQLVPKAPKALAGSLASLSFRCAFGVDINTNQFSTYAIAYSDSQPIPPDTDDSDEQSVSYGHDHSFEWVYDTEGNMVYKCSLCGAISGSKIPVSLYAKFQEDTTNKIKTAKGKITINTDTWMSFLKSVIEELSQHPDIELTIQYRHGGKRYNTTIPAGYDVKALLNEDGYVGFLYLNKIFGRIEQ